MMLPIKKLFTLPVNKLWLKEIVPDNKCIPIANKQITHWKPVLNVHTFLKGHVKSISSALFPKEETSMFTLNALFGPLKFGIPPKNHMVIPHIFMEVVLNTKFLNLKISLKIAHLKLCQKFLLMLQSVFHLEWHDKSVNLIDIQKQKN